MKACPHLKYLYIDVDEGTGRNVLDVFEQDLGSFRLIYLLVPRKYRRPLSGVTAHTVITAARKTALSTQSIS